MKKTISAFLIPVLMLGLAMPISVFAASEEIAEPDDAGISEIAAAVDRQPEEEAPAPAAEPEDTAVGEDAPSLDEDPDQEPAKDVYIDNTVDNSVSYVTGVIHITGSGGTQAGYDIDGTGKTVYSREASVTYSNPKTAEVQGCINDGYTEVYLLAKDIKDRGKAGEFHMSTSEVTGKVWDNRKYTTVEDSDAVLIGDSDYLTGAYGVSDSYTRTHIASGDYGKETFYRVEANGWVSGFDIRISQSGSGTAASDLETSLSGEEVTVSYKADPGWVLDIASAHSASDSHQLVAVVYGDSGETEDSFVFTMPKDDVDISVTFKPAVTTTYTVTFQPGDGSVIPDQTITEGGKAAKPDDPVREGFVFDGWYKDAAFTTAYDFSSAVTADTALYGKWSEAGYVLVSVTGATEDAAHTWIKGSGADVVITVKLNDGVDRSFDHFTGVQIDGETLAADTDYTARKGSTVVTLKAAALEELSLGAHAVALVFDDGQADATVTVKAAETTSTKAEETTGTKAAAGTKPAASPGRPSAPKTGDDSTPGLWIALLAASGLALAGTVYTDRKRRSTGKR